MTTNASRINILVGAFEYLESGTKLKNLQTSKVRRPDKVNIRATRLEIWLAMKSLMIHVKHFSKVDGNP